MKINPINNNYQSNNMAFQGTVDKSVVKFFKEFQTDAVRDKYPYWNQEQLNYLKDNIQPLLDKLRNFMATTHPKNILSFTNTDIGRQFVLKNKALGRINSLVKLDNHDAGIDNRERFSRRRDDDTDKKLRHNFKDFQFLEEWVNGFVKKNPQEFDKMVYDSYIKSIELCTNVFGKFITNRMITKAEKYAKEFGYEKAPLEKFYAEQKQAQTLMRETKIAEKKRNDIIKSVKDVKIK